MKLSIIRQKSFWQETRSAHRRDSSMERPIRRQAFTLVEILIVVAIISILAAIAIPNYLEAQTRARVARVQSEFRSIATALETFRVDHNRYPLCANDHRFVPESIYQSIGVLTEGLSTFQTGVRECDNTVVKRAGIDFHTLTTPIPYLTTLLGDPFAQQYGGNIPYAYRSTDYELEPDIPVAPAFGWILTSPGPDTDLLENCGVGSKDIANPLSTAHQLRFAIDKCGTSDPTECCCGVRSLADINEHEVIQFMINKPVEGTIWDLPYFHDFMTGLTYDPTNGTVSEGDLWRMGP